MSRRKDDKTGYGKPPVASRFRKGQSGNPKGRPRGSRNFATDVAEVLSAPVTVTENGEQKKVSSQRAAIMRLREKALKGDARSLERLLELAREQSAEAASRAEERVLTALEGEILERYDADLLARNGLAAPAGGEEGAET